MSRKTRTCDGCRKPVQMKPTTSPEAVYLHGWHCDACCGINLQQRQQWAAEDRSGNVVELPF